MPAPHWAFQMAAGFYEVSGLAPLRLLTSFISKGVISASNGILRLLKLALSRLIVLTLSPPLSSQRQ